MKKSLEDRFMAKVRKDGSNGCWIWTANKTHDGYGQIQILGRNSYAQQVAK